eukprot:comp21721_c0_seq3/m.48422 comp21721_c0_seq3/g.48422  ORF comp21721_c0_seq3/g.48422 comp21721_c0_seq3/m.48422 type:complete len:459 (+) comp21721_c0_seq3:630-2006(+)
MMMMMMVARPPFFSLARVLLSLFQVLRDLECDFHRLRIVEARIAVCRVVLAQIVLLELHGATKTLGDVFAGHFEMHTAAHRAHVRMDLECADHLVDHIVKAARLAAVREGDCIAMHRVDGPDHIAHLRRAHRIDECREHLGHIGGAEPRIEHDAAFLVVWIQGADQLNHFLGLGCRTQLHADRIADPAKVLDMRTIELARAVSDPQQMGRHVVESRTACDSRHGLARECFLVLEQHALVRRKELNTRERIVAAALDTAGREERKTVLELVENVAVLFLFLLVLDKLQIPPGGAMQVAKSISDAPADVVHCCGAVEVGLHKPVWVWLAAARVKAVDDVALEDIDHGSVSELFGGIRARLGILACNAPDTHNGCLCAPHKHQRHLQDDLELGVDRAHVAVEKPLRTVAALQQEPLPARHLREIVSEALDFLALDQRREHRDLVDGCRDRARILGLLQDLL